MRIRIGDIVKIDNFYVEVTDVPDSNIMDSFGQPFLQITSDGKKYDFPEETIFGGNVVTFRGPLAGMERTKTGQTIWSDESVATIVFRNDEFYQEP